MKMEDLLDTAARPSDWPCNERERRLDILIKAFDDFIDNPTFATKEVLVTFACDHDLNQNFSRGRFRIDDYEGALLNRLYMQALMHNVMSVRVYVYEHIVRVTRLYKMVRMIDVSETHSLDLPENIDAFQGLFPPLKLFYVAYRAYNFCKDQELSYYLIETVREVLNGKYEDCFIQYIQRAYVNLLNDLSYSRGTKHDALFKFSRAELKGLFELQAELLNRVGEDPSVRPLMGVLCTQISNFVLRSRNVDDKCYIVKYIRPEDAAKAARNNQIWMHTFDSLCLNDRREGKLMREVVSAFHDPKYPWVCDIEAEPSRIYHVCCFSRKINDPAMKSVYGECMYGFNNDRMVDLLSPIGKVKKYRKSCAGANLPEVVDSVMNAQVIPMDILYGREAAHDEFEYLCSIIDMFKVSPGKKKRFLEEIIQYWIYSVKDAKNEGGEWASEKEHRYVFFTYAKQEFVNAAIDGKFFKVETSLYMFPDFVLGENPGKGELRRRADEKRIRTSFRDYVFCPNCLMRDYDLAATGTYAGRCPICGSENASLVHPGI